MIYVTLTLIKIYGHELLLQTMNIPYLEKVFIFTKCELSCQMNVFIREIIDQ